MSFDLENERTLVCAFLNGTNSERTKLSLYLQPEHFVGGRFREIYTAALNCLDKQLSIDIDSLLSVSNGDCGGREFISSLISRTKPANIEYHIKRQLDYSCKLKMRDILLPKLQALADDTAISSDDFFDYLNREERRFRLPKFDSNNDFFNGWAELFDYRASGQDKLFHSVGYKEIDEVLTYGFARGKMTVLAGRTGHGKTTMVVDIESRLLASPTPPKIVHFTLEHTRSEYLDKLASRLTLIPIMKHTKDAAELTLEERDELKSSILLLEKLGKLRVIENPFFKMEKWDNRIAMQYFRSVLEEEDYDIAVIDLFARALRDSRPYEIEIAICEMQNILQSTKTHGILVHQIKRLGERKDKRPSLEDLKGSGGYEEYPDLIWLLHRPRMFKMYSHKSDVLEVNIAKQRDGRSGMTYKFDFMPHVFMLDNPTESKNKKDVETDEDSKPQDS